MATATVSKERIEELITLRAPGTPEEREAVLNYLLAQASEAAIKGDSERVNKIAKQLADLSRAQTVAKKDELSKARDGFVTTIKETVLQGAQYLADWAKENAVPDFSVSYTLSTVFDATSPKTGVHFTWEDMKTQRTSTGASRRGGTREGFLINVATGAKSVLHKSGAEAARSIGEEPYKEGPNGKRFPVSLKYLFKNHKSETAPQGYVWEYAEEVKPA